MKLFLYMRADEGSPTEIHPSYPANLGWDGRGIPLSCFSPRRTRPIAPHRRTRSTRRAGDKKGIIFAKPRFRPTLFNTPTLSDTLRVECASDLLTDDFAS